MSAQAPLRGGPRKQSGRMREHKATKQPVAELVLAGSMMKSMPRMRKPWLRAYDTPTELLEGRPFQWTNEAIDDIVSREPQEPLSHLDNLRGLGVGLDDVGHVNPSTMKELEDTFLQGMAAVGDRTGEDLSFLNDISSTLDDSLSSPGNPGFNIDNIPPLDLHKPKEFHKKATALLKLVPPHRAGLASKEDLQPYLGAKLKKSLAKLGLEKQKLSLQPDEWDDDVVINMLGTNFASKEEVRLM